MVVGIQNKECKWRTINYINHYHLESHLVLFKKRKDRFQVVERPSISGDVHIYFIDSLSYFGSFEDSNRILD
jgi:hypothetical protein